MKTERVPRLEKAESGTRAPPVWVQYIRVDEANSVPDKFKCMVVFCCFFKIIRMRSHINEGLPFFVQNTYNAVTIALENPH